MVDNRSCYTINSQSIIKMAVTRRNNGISIRTSNNERPDMHVSSFIFLSCLIDASFGLSGEVTSEQCPLYDNCSDSDALRTSRHYRVLDWAERWRTACLPQANCPMISSDFCKYSATMYNVWKPIIQTIQMY
jgi:hypothetical protein